jgi:uncharacterized YigZ family protein
MNSFKTISEVKDVLVKEKSSKFIGYGFYVSNEAQVKEKLEQLRNIHSKANHHCYAYRLGLDKYNFRANDDGEPTGTAGKPILGQIDSNSLTNCLIIVVRYFGGIKLGVSGLIDAYKETAKQTIESATIIEYAIMVKFKINCNYSTLDLVYRTISKNSAQILEQKIENESSFIVKLEKEKEKEFIKNLKEFGIGFTLFS